jgi:magnesium transporter
MRRVFPESGDPIWIDLHNPTSEETRDAHTACGLTIPTRETLDEIETSSRLQAWDNVLLISLPVTPHNPDGEPVSTPIGLMLTPDLLVTVRFDELHTFHQVREQIDKEKGACSPAQIFMLIVEAIVDYGADRLEAIKSDARKLSTGVFHGAAKSRRNIARKNRMLREAVTTLGDMGERLSEIRETLLALQRALPFVEERGHAWIDDDIRARLKTSSADIQSLNDFEVHLTDKVQFLLDATLGFINTEQNDIFKVLTIASVIGIPPTFFASMYGMNFHNMPEYNWAWGYEWGLGLIIVSTIIPIAWFKWRGWW